MRRAGWFVLRHRITGKSSTSNQRARGYDVIEELEAIDSSCSKLVRFQDTTLYHTTTPSITHLFSLSCTSHLTFTTQDTTLHHNTTPSITYHHVTKPIPQVITLDTHPNLQYPSDPPLYTSTYNIIHINNTINIITATITINIIYINTIHYLQQSFTSINSTPTHHLRPSTLSRRTDLNLQTFPAHPK
ncbi:hypothetical protein Pmani_025511 [Petrolisthes manimaculis]|uniref:Uncharacterized protein n=1 Tax=Petrolisthes manimaculis TaxID=1843537 RepID=A0AAE1P7M5_9EUCA|nr:hypothetical protein Pmani_025511 [Petrolisthes manimaculis]